MNTIKLAINIKVSQMQTWNKSFQADAQELKKQARRAHEEYWRRSLPLRAASLRGIRIRYKLTLQNKEPFHLCRTHNQITFLVSGKHSLTAARNRAHFRPTRTKSHRRWIWFRPRRQRGFWPCRVFVLCPWRWSRLRSCCHCLLREIRRLPVSPFQRFHFK